LLVNDIVPSAHPDTVGVNVKSTVALAPAATVKGRVRPVTPNSGMVAPTAVIVTLLDPEFVRTTGTISLCFSAIVPNLTFLGLQLIWPVCAAALGGAKLSKSAVVRVREQIDRSDRA